MMLKRMFKHKSVKVFAIVTFLAFMALSQHACVDSLDSNDGSENPINTFLLGLSANPNTQFGNASEESFIQVDTLLVPDGSPISYEITFSSGLPPSLRGCLFGGSATVENNSAFVNYLSGVLIGVGEIATVNISATVDILEGPSESDFITVTLEGIGITPPDDQDIEVPNPGDTEAADIFLTLIFNTTGVTPGTIAEVSLSNPGIGLFDGTSDVVLVPVQGSVDAGEFVVQYNAFRAGGTQVITARIQLEVPPDLAAVCPVPDPEDLLIEAVVVITQSVAPPPDEEEEDGEGDGGDGG